jgi:hypothetical protein
MKFTRLLCALVLFCVGQTALAWDRPEMSKYGKMYYGDEYLQVVIAHNAADDHAVLKISGINHLWDGQVFWAKVKYWPGKPARASYLIPDKEDEDGERHLFFVGGHDGTLYIHNWHGQEYAEIGLYYSREGSDEVRPEHLATDYETQIGQVK